MTCHPNSLYNIKSDHSCLLPMPSLAPPVLTAPESEQVFTATNYPLLQQIPLYHRISAQVLFTATSAGRGSCTIKVHHADLCDHVCSQCGQKRLIIVRTARPGSFGIEIDAGKSACHRREVENYKAQAQSTSRGKVEITNTERTFRPRYSTRQVLI